MTVRHPSELKMDALLAHLEPYQRLALAGMSGHQLHRTALEAAAKVDGVPFAGLEPRYIRFSDGAMLDANMNVVDGGAKITIHGYDPAEAIRGREITAIWHDEMEGTDMLDETAPPPQAIPTDPAGPPPQALSNHVNHRDFHPSYMRVGVRIDGVERKDLKWYDVRAGLAATTDGVMLKSETIEPFWRYPENRQQRRARERLSLIHI